MVGGLLSAIAFLDSVPRVVPDSDLRITMLVIVVALCGLSVLSGYALFQGRWAGRGPSLVVQGVQLLGFGVGPEAFRVILGPYLLIGLIPNQWMGLSIGWQPQLHVHLRDLSPGYYLNVMALACLWYLAFEWRTPDRHAGTPELNSDAPAV